MGETFTFKYKFFQIPACGDSILETDLNDFLERHAVLDVRQEFVSAGSDAHWCFSIRWRKGGLSSGGGRKSHSRIDYKEVLEPEAFVLFAQLRDFRKEIATKESVPTYAVFTNEQLAEMARRRPQDIASLKELDGVGPSRTEKYGELFLERLRVEAPVAES
jgi:superfamily II DNA helicase RecQ